MKDCVVEEALWIHTIHCIVQTEWYMNANAITYTESKHNFLQDFSKLKTPSAVLREECPHHIAKTIVKVVYSIELFKINIEKSVLFCVHRHSLHSLNSPKKNNKEICSIQNRTNYRPRSKEKHRHIHTYTILNSETKRIRDCNTLNLLFITTCGCVTIIPKNLVYGHFVCGSLKVNYANLMANIRPSLILECFIGRLTLFYRNNWYHTHNMVFGFVGLVLGHSLPHNIYYNGRVEI